MTALAGSREGNLESVKLTATEVAVSAGTSPEEFQELVEVGFVTPEPDGRFRLSDIARVRLVRSLNESGVAFGELAEAVSEDRLTLDYVDKLMPEPVSLVEPLDEDEEALRWASDWAPILGTSPSPHGLVRTDDLRLLHMMSRAVEIGIPSEQVIRIARSFAQVVSRLVEVQREFVDEVLLVPAIEETGSPMAALEKTSAVRYQYRKLGRALLIELMDRQIDDAIFRNLIQLTELALAEGGVDTSRVHDGVAFIDIGEYSRLSEVHGDAEAAIQASRLANLIQELARDHGGRLVKSLGDGALVHAPAAAQALAVALDAIDATQDHGIWPLHAGVNVGPVVLRDGDLFGSAVNAAARLAEVAKPGEVVVSRSVVDTTASSAVFVFDPAGEARLKNISAPMEVFRARRRPHETGVD
ncbi:MAG TPA: adenylate/guanylate cyclase domain-containing protein [Acidimicrobiia bacterium]|nr:adenylate/guanylate cyclase domain-containing protein [Acidimicrobiia bacterium]